MSASYTPVDATASGVRPGSPYSMRADSDRGTGGALFVVAIVALLFFGVGLQAWRGERHRLATYRPTPARVVSTTVVVNTDGDGGVTYRPAIRYAYDARGRQWTADRVTPLAQSGGERWARATIARYSPGMAVTAYVDPSDPSRAFLERRRSALPVAFMSLGGAVLVYVGAFAASARRR